MTPELRNAIKKAYEIFPSYRISKLLCVGRCNMCMSEDVERLLVRTALRSIPPETLAEYTNSAHDWIDGIVDIEMRHFLPRYLELIGLHLPPDNIGMDICLRRLRDARWRSWPKEEANTLEAFFDELVRDSLGYLDPQLLNYGWKLSFDLSEILTLIIAAGGDLERALAIWDAAPDPGAIAHMVAMRAETLTHYGEPYLDTPFLDDFRPEAEKGGAFARRPEFVIRIEEAFFATIDPAMQQILSDALP
jgi:hypothetical protein